MSKYFPASNLLRPFFASRADVAKCREAMQGIIEAARGRPIAMPEVRGGFLLHVVKTCGADVQTMPRRDFQNGRDEVIEQAKARRAEVEQRREQKLDRMFPATVGASGVTRLDPERAKQKAAALARSKARKAELAKECIARKGGGGGSQNQKGGKSKAA
jgi:hypothetical protein